MKGSEGGGQARLAWGCQPSVWMLSEPGPSGKTADSGVLAELAERMEHSDNLPQCIYGNYILKCSFRQFVITKDLACAFKPYR